MGARDITVLIIDDDEDDYLELRDILSEVAGTKYNLLWKPSYEEGLTSLLEDAADICLLDYRLGNRTGLDLLVESRKQGSLCPVIFLTGYGDLDIDLTAMNAGAADFLVKGQISQPLLERAIRYSIKNAHDLQELSAERENFQTLFNSTFEGIIVHSQGKIKAANRAFCDIFKCSSENLVDQELISFVRPDFRDEIKRQLNSGRDLRLEAIGLTSDNSEIYLAISSRTVNLKGTWAALVAVQDLTERKTMETQILQQDRLASLGLLASSLAHEIGTPLGVIRGRAELVQSKSSDANTKEVMALIVSQIDRISKLVRSLLHIARGRSSESTSDVNLNAVLSDVLSLMSHELERNQIELELAIQESILVKAESGPLGQVFLNLIMNAIHAILSDDTKKQRKIKISSLEIDREVRVAIEDTGIGIAEKDFPRLFQPFFTTKEIGEGTGLGLATSYKLVTSWGGYIEARSKVGHGTIFTVTLQK